jgi:hypothetical protein
VRPNKEVSFNKQTINFRKLGKTREHKGIFHSLSRNSKSSRNFSCPKQLPTRKVFWKENSMFFSASAATEVIVTHFLKQASTGETYIFCRQKNLWLWLNCSCLARFLQPSTEKTNFKIVSKNLGLKQYLISIYLINENMETKMPKMYFSPNLYKVEPLPKYSIKFLQHELDCRSLRTNDQAHQFSPDYKTLITRCRNRLKTYVKSSIP